MREIVYDDGEYQIAVSSHPTSGTYYYLMGEDLTDGQIQCSNVKEARKIIELLDKGILTIGRYGQPVYTVELPRDAVHITKEDLGESAILDPKFSKRIVEGMSWRERRQTGYVTSGLEGISFALNVESAINAIPFPWDDELYGKGRIYSIYSPVESKKAMLDPERFQEPELRVSEPIKVGRVGKLFLRENVNEGTTEWKIL